MAGKVITPVKVGVLVVAAFSTFAIFLQILSTRGFDDGGAYRVHALFDDVLGLEKKSPVQIAGIDIGSIEKVELFEGKAKVTLTIKREVALFEDASIEKVSISLLGDYKLSVEPGGGPGAKRLEDGGVIKKVSSLSDTDAIIEEVRTMTESIRALIAGRDGQQSPLERIVYDVEGSASAARNVLETVSGSIGNNTEKLDQILENVNRFTRDLSDISKGRDRDIDALLSDSKAIAASLRNTAKAVETAIAGENQGEITETVSSLKDSLETMGRSIESLSSILAKIDDGQGTVGALINERGIHDGLEDTVEEVNELVGGVNRLQTWVNLRSEFQFRSGKTKNYVQFTLMPKEDKYYIFEVVDDPRGVRETVIEDVETTSPQDGRSFQYRERRTTTKDDLKFSLMFAKRFYWLGLRFGIIEGTGGIGADLHFLDDRLEFLVDANQFGVEARNPRIKILALAELVPHVYLHGGVDDFLNPGTLDYFVGAGVRFNDEDIKTLLLTGGIPGLN